mmetsp:Transcript_7464/g.16268  ORF Transcript_7464/g.16268 Transcript_7464/m.16268 type:complete len:412 (-) Transcript_7464:181-1416(-)
MGPGTPQASAGVGFAPLSQGQTLAITRQLQDLIQKTNQRVDELSLSVKEHADGIASLKDYSTEVESRTTTLEERLAALYVSLDASIAEVQRNKSAVQLVEEGLERAKEKTSTLRDAYRITNLNVQQAAQDFAKTHSLATRLEAVIEQRLEVALDQLKEDLGTCNLSLKHLKEDGQTMQASHLQDKEALRETNDRLCGVIDDLAETKTMLSIVEQRGSDLNSCMKANRQAMDALNVTMLKLLEDGSVTSTKFTELGNLLKGTQGQVKQVGDSVKTLTSSHQSAQHKLNEHAHIMDNIRGGLEETRTQLTGLSQGHDLVKRHIHQLHSNVAEANQTALAVKAGLKDTSQLLLPNIGMDSSEALSMIKKHGSILDPGVFSMPGVPGTSPRKSFGTPRGSRISAVGGRSMSSTWT